MCTTPMSQNPAAPNAKPDDPPTASTAFNFDDIPKPQAPGVPRMIPEAEQAAIDRDKRFSESPTDMTPLFSRLPSVNQFRSGFIRHFPGDFSLRTVVSSIYEFISLCRLDKDNFRRPTESWVTGTRGATGSPSSHRDPRGSGCPNRLGTRSCDPIEIRYLRMVFLRANDCGALNCSRQLRSIVASPFDAQG